MPEQTFTEYVELVDNTQLSTASFAYNGTTAGMNIEITDSTAINNDVITYVQKVLGYPSWSPGIITRYLPMRHPQFPWLRATRVMDVMGVVNSGNITKYDNNTAGIANWNKTRFKIQFESLPYDVLDEDAISDPLTNEPDEGLRFVEYRKKFSLEQLQLQGGEYYFYGGGTGNGIPADVAHSAKATTTIGHPISKEFLSWTWHQVPDGAIYDINRQTPNLTAIFGKVNLTEFYGYPAGTLACLPPDIEPHEAPANPANMGKKNGGLEPLTENNIPRIWDVTYNFLYFNPQPITSPGAGGLLMTSAGNVPIQGHNCAPFRHNFNDWKLLLTVGGNSPRFAAAEFNDFVFVPL